MAEFSGQVPFFLDNFLSRPASALPKGSQWVLVFEGIPDKAIKTGIKYEPRQWDIETAIVTTLGDDYQKTKCCLFAQAVQIPGEGSVINPQGLQYNGFLQTNVGGGRNVYNGVQISFLETNVSFVDNVIRPWVIATAHLGMIAREGDLNYRTNMTVYKLGVLAPERPPHVLQKFTFFGCCPIDVTGEEYNYTQVTSPVNREATFNYHYYNVESATNQAINNPRIPVPLSTKNKNVSIKVAQATVA